ncbi:hypothetical protein AB205_0173560 [Aquarana catesbeiana]|uniref:Muscarinic acetylcholine receptor n=1 Tax=Aquarana catesbeiana TaxID=8400 RepID=A0A2G9SG49_AQUCT|nr:hypothetical protein AB205_0173560 [Aquarana catesbeiana]
MLAFHQNAGQESVTTWLLIMNNTTIDPLTTNSTEPPYHNPFGAHAIWEVVLIVITTGILSFITVVGNVLVFLAFKVNSDLKTVNNYFILSLACADVIIGAISMNLYTTYIIMGRWALGNVSCDLWLALDYVASNASVMNLLIISFDRYFSITRPLTYRAKRTPRRAAIMIGLAWIISFILWAPAILCWQYIVGERTVEPDACYIQFLSEPTITFGTAIAAFYLPVTIMIILYWRIYRETENRSRELAGLQGSETENIVRPVGSVRSGSSSGMGESERLPRSQTSVPRVRRTCFGTPTGSRGSNDTLGREDAENEANGRKQEVSRKPSKSQALALPSTIIKAKIDKTRHGKRKSNSLIKEKKAARTLSAILLAFILTWTPYNIMVLVSTFCKDCIPTKLWELGYWLCYVNSTVNPMCYALCNRSFRRTFKMLLLCRWDKRKWRTHRHQAAFFRTPSQ